jgi:allantoinase
MAHAFQSNRVVTPQGIRRAAILLEDGPAGVIRAVCDVADLPVGTRVVDFGERAILPGLVDTHVHINEPGRTEWEGFATATRAAAAGGFTTLVDMPLNCLPETTTVEALEIKRAAAQGSVAWTGLPGEEPSPIIRPTCCRSPVPAFPATSVSSSTPAATASP